MNINMIKIYRDHKIILQKRILEGGEYIELELRFPALRDTDDQLLISIAGMYIVFKEPHGLNYVVSSWTFQKFVLRSMDFTSELQNRLITVLTELLSRMGLVHWLSEQLFYVPDRGGMLLTNDDLELKRFQIAECPGKTFVEQLYKELHKLS